MDESSDVLKQSSILPQQSKNKCWVYRLKYVYLTNANGATPSAVQELLPGSVPEIICIDVQ